MVKHYNILIKSISIGILINATDDESIKQPLAKFIELNNIIDKIELKPINLSCEIPSIFENRIMNTHILSQFIN